MRLARLCFLAALCVVGAAADTFNFTYTVYSVDGFLGDTPLAGETVVFSGAWDTADRVNGTHTSYGAFIAAPLTGAAMTIGSMSPVTFTGGLYMVHYPDRHFVDLVLDMSGTTGTGSTIYNGFPSDGTWVMLDGWQMDRAIAGMNTNGFLAVSGWPYATSGGLVDFYGFMGTHGWGKSGLLIVDSAGAVPEPTSFALGALCLAALALARGRFARR